MLVILNVVKDPRLHFHRFEWNSVPCLTALKITRHCISVPEGLAEKKQIFRAPSSRLLSGAKVGGHEGAPVSPFHPWQVGNTANLLTRYAAQRR
jgi:hypothetical protein